MSFESINCGLLTSKTVSAGSGNEATIVKAVPGKVFKIIANNVNAAVRYLKLYDRTTAPTVGSSTIKMTLAIPAASVQTFDFGDNGVLFSSGIVFAMTTEATDAGSTNVSASEHVINVCYI